jgi:glycosyltransferase involved in cell wall biosynthesis
VCEPTAAALAAGLRRVMDDAAAAERMGQAGAARAATLRWDATVDALLHGRVKTPV